MSDSLSAIWGHSVHFYSFHLVSTKVDEDIGHHDGIQSVTFLGDGQTFKNLVALRQLHFH